MVKDLIYDVGMYDGYDTAYYLACGYRVVAIDADPSLVAAARKRFQAEIEAKKLTILNVGIADHHSEAEFWINEAMASTNTFKKELTSRFGDPHHTIKVQCRPLIDVIAEYGVPYYLKIDIEDYDIICLNQLSHATRPKYISVEMTDGELGEQLLSRLCELGYDRFRVINQRHLLPVGWQKKGLRGGFFWWLYEIANYQKQNRSLPLRTLRAAVAQVLKMAQVTGLWGVSAYRSRAMPHWNFVQGSSSGSFGEDLPGSWCTADETRQLWSREVAVCQRLVQIPWHDLHATISTLPE